MEKYEIEKVLGSGSYSKVYEGVDKQTRNKYAIKVVELHNLSQKGQQNALNEVRLLSSINHKNIIGYREAFIDQNRLNVVMEYANEGDLEKLILLNKK